MQYRVLIGSLLCVLATASSATKAGVTVTLSSPTDLTTLTVGQEVEIDVTVSGLPSPNSTDFIFNLNTKVLFPSIFTPVPDATSPSGLTAVVAPGSVFDDNVLGPLQIGNFQYQGVKPDGLPDSTLAAGAAIGNFSQYPNTNSGALGLNGLYYSFLLRVTSAGSGSIQFDSTPGANEYAANDTGFNYAPLGTGRGLSVDVRAVPEPGSIGLLGAGGVILGCLRRFRRRASA